MTGTAAEFTCDPGAARAARELVTTALRVWNLDDLSEIAELLTTELVTNAILHAGTPVRVVAHRSTPEVVVVKVFDGSPRLPSRSPRASDPDAERGRGLFLIDQLANCWGAEPADGGKVVWFTLRTAS